MVVKLDYRFIEQHVPEGTRVLDLGCGDGSLLQRLINQKDIEGLGVDVDEAAARECVARGVPVYHGDMFEGTEMFSEDTFDCVILSRTLQQSRKPRGIVEEMLRIGRKAIISFPNFGHWKARLALAFAGCRPILEGGEWEWYDTPDVHPLSIRDFSNFCDELNLEVLDRVFYSSGYYKIPPLMANLFAANAVFVIQKKSG